MTGEGRPCTRLVWGLVGVMLTCALRSRPHFVPLAVPAGLRCDLVTAASGDGKPQRPAGRFHRIGGCSRLIALTRRQRWWQTYNELGGDWLAATALSSRYPIPS